MSRQLMITAKKELGPALQGFELGNEVRQAAAAVSSVEVIYVTICCATAEQERACLLVST